LEEAAITTHSSVTIVDVIDCHLWNSKGNAAKLGIN
jgi:hypothetical protein